MADSNLVTQEEMALRRRARRRLVGAVAIALAAVVALPMLFDPEPKPLGPEVDLRIPAKDTPFEPAPGAPAAAPAPTEPEPAPQMAEPTQPAPQPQAQAAQPTPPAEAKPLESKPATAPAGESKPEKPALKEAVKPEKSVRQIESKADEVAITPAKPEPRPEIKSAPKPDAAFASKGFYLQLGAFGSEINAKQLQEKARAAGFKAGLNAANGQFRVRVGPIAEHDKALEMQAKLKAKGFNPVLLGP